MAIETRKLVLLSLHVSTKVAFAQSRLCKPAMDWHFVQQQFWSAQLASWIAPFESYSNTTQRSALRPAVYDNI